MFLNHASLLTARRWKLPVALGAVLLTSSVICLAGCGGSKPPTPPPGSATALSPDAGPAKDQEILKETAKEKNPEGGPGPAGSSNVGGNPAAGDGK
jgi:hypothetical protein